MSRRAEDAAAGRLGALAADVPLLAVLGLLCLVLGGALLLQILRQQDLYFLDRFHLGLDYADFHEASRHVLEGRSPYQAYRYVTTPVPALLNVPLALLPFPSAALAMSGLVFASVALALWLLYRIFPAQQRRGWPYLPAGFLLLAFSYPFCFLFDRGNIDGIVLLLMAAGLACLGRRDALAGIAFGMATVFKVYPVLAVLPLLAQRRWKALFFFALAGIAAVACMPNLWLEFLRERLLVRNADFRADENGSIGVTFYFVGSIVEVLSRGEVTHEIGRMFMRFGFLFYLALLGVFFGLDLRRGKAAEPTEQRARAAAYLPFMVAVPQLVYHYEFICVLALLPMVSWCWARAIQGWQRRLLLLISVGIAASQFQAIAYEKLTGTVYPHFIPGFGLLLVMVGLTLFRLWENRSLSRQTA